MTGIRIDITGCIYRKDNILARFNLDSFRSYALAAFVSLYASVILLAIVGQNGAAVGRLIV